ncbi:MAG: TauD/TfdA family dioxygenase [Rubrivivax sp.]|nr:TauD/TfdA family dioxygenase [Rubrivivax sp.]
MSVAHADLDASPRAGAGRHAFDLDDDASYRRWRAWKLRHRTRDAAALAVDVRDLRAVQPAERARLLQTIGRHGVAVYRSPQREAASDLPRALGAQLGLVRLHANWLADEDGISPIAVARAGDAAAGEAPAARGEFIPYTDRAIGWHTDGYYQSDAQRILGMILHCVRPAAHGGETALADPEQLFIALRDEDPALVRALMHPQAMSIPPREDEAGVARAEQAGPVFSLLGGGPGRAQGTAPAARAGRSSAGKDGGVTGHLRLHMRYTARTRSIRWREDAATREAAARITALLAQGDFVLRLRLEAGMGVVGHNVLHLRTAFTDDPAAPRLLYRARYLDRIVAPEEDAWRLEGAEGVEGVEGTAGTEGGG